MLDSFRDGKSAQSMMPKLFVEILVWALDHNVLILIPRTLLY